VLGFVVVDKVVTLLMFKFNDDSWLYDGEDELNYALLDRQKEMDFYD
jgi:hypothetical protein